MQVAVRPRLAVGASLVAASALLISPISPSAPASIQVPAISSAIVDLAASANPIQQWADVIGGVVTNVVGIGSAVVSNPAPILRAILTNQVGYAQTVVSSLGALGDSLGTWATQVVPAELQKMVTALSQGNTVGAANAVNNIIATLVFAAFPAMPILAIPVKMAESLVRGLTAATDMFTTLLSLVSGVVSPIQGVVEALGDQSQAVINAMGAGDPLAALGAVINTPGVLAGAILNGYTAAYENDGYKQFFPGLLTWNPAAPHLNGLFAALFVTIPKFIADAIAGPASMAFKTAAPTETAADGIASLPDPTATTVSLETPTDTVVETPKTEVDPVSNTVEVEPVTTAPVVVAPVAVEPVVVEPVVVEPVVEPVVEKVTVTEETDNVAVTKEDSSAVAAEKEKPADTRTDTKDGNKAEPGKVNTGVSNNGSSTTTAPSKTDTETAATPDKPATGTGTVNTGSDSDSSSSNSSGSGDSGNE
jgi:outer membrane biosynthesis protein TonB